MRRAMASSFEVEAMVRGYHLYKVMWDAKVGKQLFPFFLKYKWHLQARVLINGRV